MTLRELANPFGPNNAQSKPMNAFQVPNEAGGYSWPLSDMDRINRFIVLGTEGGGYYVDQPKLTIQSIAALERVLAQGDEAGVAVVNMVRDISVQGRAAKQSPALFALAICLSRGSNATKQRAVEVFNDVVRTGSTFAEVVSYLDAMRGHGRAFRRALRGWYATKSAGQLAFQLVKYRERAGWSQRDLLRTVKPKLGPEQSEVAAWAVKGWPGVGVEPHPDSHLRQIWAYERAKAVAGGDLSGLAPAGEDPGEGATEAEIVRLIRDFRLPRECVPTEMLNSVRVWDALLQDMPIGALVRNLGKMSQVGLLDSSEARNLVTARLTDEDRLRRGRIHPINILAALKVYAQGKGVRGSLKWRPEPRVLDALDAGLYACMGHVQPIGKRILFAVDVSSSMQNQQCNGLPYVALHEAAACLALVYLKSEPNVDVLTFSAGEKGLFRPAISASQRLDDAARAIRESGDGGTDCALPLIWAGIRRQEYDAFVVFTDNQTWAGVVHPHQALVRYREAVNPNAVLVSAAASATGTSIANPDDRGTLGLSGFDAAAPAIIASFIAGPVAASLSELDVPDAVEVQDDA